MRALIAVGLLVVAGCAGSPTATGEPTVASTDPQRPSATVTSSASAKSPLPPFESTVTEISADLATRMSTSWRPGCPVGLEELRYIRASYIDFDGHPQSGELIVHADVASGVVQVLSRLYDARFPIRAMQLVDDFSGDDGQSMAADNTSAFNCRPSSGTSDRWSEHAYGRALDVNPVENPYVTASGDVQPEAGRAYLDRTGAPGVVLADDAVVRAFAEIGWVWGGTWSSSKDFQHFSATGL